MAESSRIALGQTLKAIRFSVTRHTQWDYVKMELGCISAMMVILLGLASAVFATLFFGWSHSAFENSAIDCVACGVLSLVSVFLAVPSLCCESFGRLAVTFVYFSALVAIAIGSVLLLTPIMVFEIALGVRSVLARLASVTQPIRPAGVFVKLANRLGFFADAAGFLFYKSGSHDSLQAEHCGQGQLGVLSTLRPACILGGA